MNQHKQKSWFGRNWKWLLPVGGCLTILVVGVLGIGGIFYGVTKVMKNSVPYEYAINQASENENVIDALGESLESSGMTSGNISYSGDTGEADLKIPVKGSKGEGLIIVVAKKHYEEWTYETLYIVIKDTNEKINLLEKGMEGV